MLLHWGHGGWVHLFSRQPIRSVDDLKKQKLFVWAGDDALVQQWKKNGFQPVPLAATDILMGFQTKMIDAVPTTPIAALSLQWFRQTPYMLGLGLGAAGRRRRGDQGRPGRSSRPPTGEALAAARPSREEARRRGAEAGRRARSTR